MRRPPSPASPRIRGLDDSPLLQLSQTRPGRAAGPRGSVLAGMDIKSIPSSVAFAFVSSLPCDAQRCPMTVLRDRCPRAVRKGPPHPPVGQLEEQLRTATADPTRHGLLMMTFSRRFASRPRPASSPRGGASTLSLPGQFAPRDSRDQRH
jgi:hypothetical protein